MKKTLWCAEKETASAFEMPKYKRVTAEKVDEIEAGVQNLYKDADGNKYIVHYNKFMRRSEFVRV